MQYVNTVWKVITYYLLFAKLICYSYILLSLSDYKLINQRCAIKIVEPRDKISGHLPPSMVE